MGFCPTLSTLSASLTIKPLLSFAAPSSVMRLLLKRNGKLIRMLHQLEYDQVANHHPKILPLKGKFILMLLSTSRIKNLNLRRTPASQRLEEGVGTTELCNLSATCLQPVCNLSAILDALTCL